MIHTARLVLRDWRDDDGEAHNSLCADPRVAAMLGSTPSLEESRAVVARQQALAAERGYCFWALEYEERFSGWCGIKPGKPPIEGEIEIGWTLAPALWSCGLATEAARAALAWTWERTAAPRVTAITAETNSRSRALMERIGMTHDGNGDFDHPELSADHPLRRHVLYRIDRARG